MTRTTMRVGGALGIAHVAVLLAGFALYVTYADPTAPLRDRFVDSDAIRVYAGGYIEAVGYLLFLPFAAFLVKVLRMKERASFAADTAMGAAAVYLASTLTPGLAAFGAATAGGHDGDVDASGLTALDNLRMFSYYVSLLAFATFLAAVAVSALVSRALPRWLAGSAGGLAVLLALGVAGAGQELQEIPGLLSFAWVVAVSVWALRSAPQATGSTGGLPAGSAATHAIAGAPLGR